MEAVNNRPARQTAASPHAEETDGQTPPIKPWDARLAALLVRPLIRTRVHPNHVTTLSLLTGLAAAALYGTADRQAANWGAGVYVLTNLLDHADGELARLAGKTSVAGGAFDRLSDLVVRASLFIGMGLGLRAGPLGHWSIIAGVSAAATFVITFALRSELARREVARALDQPSAAGFDLGDVLYLIAPLTWLGGLDVFLVAAGVGAPMFCLWTAGRRAGR
ncbi:MAG TPA: CDP-alcohol phosphatidyltransferase family protein [Candidatus Methylomirabilis sp.]|nr:CDP-alcohol phosphatidyltransferase family protein [Candidatus Methylomirabilis sp.]